MKLNKILILFLFFISNQVCADSFDGLRDCWNNLSQGQKNVVKVVTVVPLVYGAFKLVKSAYNGVVNKVNAKIEKAVEEETINSILLFFKLVKNCNEEELKTKARMVRIRNQVMQNLDKVAPEHSQVKKLKLLFSGLDFVRGWFKQNPFEYQQIGVIDSALEAKIATSITDSILFSFKDLKDCTEEEIIQKEQAKISRNRIIQKVVPELETKIPSSVKIIMAIFTPGLFVLLKATPIFVDFFFPVK